MSRVFQPVHNGKKNNKAAAMAVASSPVKQPTWMEKLPQINQGDFSELHNKLGQKKEYDARKKAAFQQACEQFCGDLVEVCGKTLVTLREKHMLSCVVSPQVADMLLHGKTYEVDGFSFPASVLMYGYNLKHNRHYCARDMQTFVNNEVEQPFITVQRAFQEQCGVWLVNKTDPSKGRKVIWTISVGKPKLEAPLWHGLNNTYDLINQAYEEFGVPESVVKLQKVRKFAARKEPVRNNDNQGQYFEEDGEDNEEDNEEGNEEGDEEGEGGEEGDEEEGASG
jgi:hypothetical protein